MKTYNKPIIEDETIEIDLPIMSNLTNDVLSGTEENGLE
jgi:hypothetical protein